MTIVVSWFHHGDMTSTPRPFPPHSTVSHTSTLPASPSANSSTSAPSAPASAPSRRALVVGAGIAGLSAATALHRAGWHPEIVERSGQRRRGGYFIMMFGSGRIAAEHLGIEGIRPRNAEDGMSYSFDRRGSRSSAPSFGDLPANPWMMLRGDVEKAAYEALPAGVPIRFSTSPVAIVQGPERTSVTLRDSSDGSERTEDYDLVVGADGLRSTVRRLVWGPHEDYLERVGDMICAFELPEALPGLPAQDGGNIIEPGRSFTVFPFRDHAPTVLFSYRTGDVDAERARAKEIGVAAHLREIYGPEPLGEMMEAALGHLESTDEFLFDSVEQVHVDHWHHGRVVLLGDAAWCPSLYSGMGATSSLSGADTLRVMLERHPESLEKALTAWEAKLREPIEEFQRSAAPMRSLFTVDTAEEIARRGRTQPVQRFLFSFPPTRAVIANLPTFRRRDSDLAA